jgi:hypothetical protein
MYGAQKYDKAQEVKITGTIVGVEEHRGAGGASGVHLRVKTDAETIEVHVAPTAFVAREGVTFKIGDAITVTGARAKWEDEDVLVVRQVQMGDRIFAVRDSEGKPLWTSKP